MLGVIWGAWHLPLLEPDPAPRGRRISVAAPSSTAEARYAESIESGHSNRSEAALIAEALGIQDAEEDPGDQGDSESEQAS